MRTLLNEIDARERAIRRDRARLRQSALAGMRRAEDFAGSLPGLATGFGAGLMLGLHRPSGRGSGDIIALIRLAVPLVKTFLAGFDTGRRPADGDPPR